jgi:N-acetylmuramoyl-L-alanine amidase
MSRLLPDDALAAVTILQEAEGEPYAGKLAVAEVIRNRTIEHYQSDGTVAGTVLRTFQFSGWNSSAANRVRCGKADDDSPMVRDCLKAWHEALEGSQTVSGALHYCRGDITPQPEWIARCRKVAEVGAHIFYIPKPRGEV